MTASKPLVSICIPTYENAENLERVLDHALSLSARDVEFVVIDDGSGDSTEQVIDRFDDRRLVYYRNDSNLGFERNLLKTIRRATGEYVLPLADEDKLNTDTVDWMMETLEESKETVGCIIGDFGNQGNWHRETWHEAVPQTRRYTPGPVAQTVFARDLPHPFAEHTWRRNYIGGFLLNRTLIDTASAEGYYGSAYIHNVLILQAIRAGDLIVTPRRVCDQHRFEHDDNHRYWEDWGNLRRRTKLQQYRRKAIDELIADPEVYKLYLRIERRFAAHVAAWALYSTEYEFSDVRQAALDGKVYSLEDVWAGQSFWLLLMYYLLILPLPVARLKDELSSGYLTSDSLTVWNQIAKRALPDSVYAGVKARVKPYVRDR